MHPEGIGASVLRREDRRFLTGRGQYVSDLSFHDELHCAFVRSPHAHARIRSIDTTEALASAGVVAVYTGDDMAADRVGTMIPLWRIPGVGGSVMKEPPRWGLSRGTARHVGEAVAMVVAATRNQALDAAEKVAVDWEPLQAVVDVRDAAAPGAVELHPEAPGNVCVQFERGTRAPVDEAFARASHKVAVDIVNHRIICAAMEPPGGHRAGLRHARTRRSRGHHLDRQPGPASHP